MSTTVPAEVHAGVLDADMSSLLWLLLDAGVPLNVVGPPGSGRRALRAALVELAGTHEVPGAVHDAASLDELLRPSGAAGHATGDQSRTLGAVVVLGNDADGQRRVVAAHYVRPVERDAEGHLQRRPPAVLYAWDETSRRWQDFGWGIVPELAARGGMSVADFERRQQERAAFLAGLAAAGIHDREAVVRAVRGIRLLGGATDHEPH